MQNETTSLPTTEFGTIPNTRKKTFYRVESWSGRFIADFSSKIEAAKFAISDARDKGLQYDHKVSTVTLVGA